MPKRYESNIIITPQARITFRLIQYSSGNNANNPVLRHEWYEYVFDALPMLFALLTLAVLHPGLWLKGPESHFPHIGRREKKEMKRIKTQQRLDRKAAAKMQSHGTVNGVFLQTLLPQKTTRTYQEV